MKIALAEEMRRIDKMAADTYGIDTLLLMENAGRAAADALTGVLGEVAGRTVCVLAGSESGHPVFLETDEPFEQEIPVPEQFAGLGELRCEPTAAVRSCEYRMPDANTVELTAELNVRCTMTASAAGNIVSDITVMTDRPKQRASDCALKLCYCSEQEDIWEIAKRYSTSISAIMEENELTDETLTHSGMLLIPMMN